MAGTLARQGQGVRVRLLDWARASLPDGFTLSTLLENERSRAFYVRHGLVEGETRPSSVNGRLVTEYRWSP